MVNNNNSGTTKRRKRRQSINFKTAREKRRAKTTHLPNSTTLNSVDSVESHSLSEKPTISEAKGQKTVDNDRVNDDSSVSTATTCTIEHRDSRRNITAPTATVSKGKAPTTEISLLKEKLPAVPRGRGKHQKISKPSKVDDVDKPTLATKEDITKSHPSSASVSSQAQTHLSDKQKQPGKRAHQTKSATQRSNNDSSLKSPKRLKMSKQNDKAFSFNNSITGKTVMAVKTRQRKNPGIPDRIKDFRVTKKAFGKWKPLAKSTKEFVDQILKSVVLNVTAYTSTKESQQAVKCLTILKGRVLERLPDLKAPHTQGDYRKMESQNKGAEETFLEKSRELNVLDQKLEEEQRLLQDQCTMVAEYTKKVELCKAELISLDNEKAHPLIREAKNVLDLPDLPEKFYNEEEVPLRENSAEEMHLCQTLMKLREKANSTGLTTWMDKLANFTEDLGKTK